MSITHGLTNTRINKIRLGILTRCNKENYIHYKNYGGRGIKIIWKTFEEFRDDMYESYLDHVEKYGEKETSIDRINNDGDYCKDNCRWATLKEQHRNTSRNIYVTHEGESKTMSERAEIFGCTRVAIRNRYKRGVDIKPTYYHNTRHIKS